MEDPDLQHTKVGIRKLPHINYQYYARTPKENAFKTVWLPVNASNRVVVDEKQDKLYLYYSRHLLQPVSSKGMNRIMIKRSQLQASDFSRPMNRRLPVTPDSVRAAMWMTNVNSLAPFAVIGKPTCGYFFSRDTDNKKRRTGIPPTNTVKWRSHSSTN